MMYKKKAYFHISSDPAFKERVMSAAKRDNRSLSGYVLAALKDKMKRDSKRG